MESLNQAAVIIGIAVLFFLASLAISHLWKCDDED